MRGLVSLHGPPHPRIIMPVDVAIKTRRSVARLRPDPVPREALEQMLDAAVWAPNHHLTEPWEFIVLMGDSRRRHTNLTVRREIWSRLQKLWYEDAASLRIGDFFEMHVHRRELKGFFEAPTNTWWNAYLDR